MGSRGSNTVSHREGTMATKALIALILIVVVSVTSGYILQEKQDVAAPRVKLDLYYESLCPFCSEFIQQQLYRTHAVFKKYMEINLNPFGNAEMTESPPGVFHFECQHGAEECKAGIIESCLIMFSQKAAPQLTVPLITCTDSQPDSLDNVKKCFSTLNATSIAF